MFGGCNIWFKVKQIFRIFLLRLTVVLKNDLCLEFFVSFKTFEKLNLS